jgi:hypothetical protein
VFVVFERPGDCYKVANGQSGGLARFCKGLVSCCFDKEDFYRWDRAPEPTDVYWENLGVGWGNRVVRSFLSNLATFLLVLVCFGAVAFLKYAQKH